jgi:hypothetical protein
MLATAELAKVYLVSCDLQLLQAKRRATKGIKVEAFIGG